MAYAGPSSSYFPPPTDEISPLRQHPTQLPAPSTPSNTRGTPHGFRYPASPRPFSALVTEAPDRQSRSLVLCFDGTANRPQQKGTNVHRLFEALEKERADLQICYYQPGIGTYTPTTSKSQKIIDKGKQIGDMAFAWSLKDHILGGYRFLMSHYQRGDKICLFGFSRGAYIARCLAGMLYAVGLLSPANEELIGFAYAKYKRQEENMASALDFKRIFSRHVLIEFVGVWDTVTSVGIAGRTLPFTTNNRIVRVFRQALALDERRTKYGHFPWYDEHEHKKHTGGANEAPSVSVPDAGEGSVLGGHARSDTGPVIEYSWEKPGSVRKVKDFLKLRKSLMKDKDGLKGEFGNDWSKYCSHKDVWFIGCHSDVGGSDDDDGTASLANPSLLWMVREMRESGVPVIFSQDAFKDRFTLSSYLDSENPELFDKHMRDMVKKLNSKIRGNDSAASTGGRSDISTTITTARQEFFGILEDAFSQEDHGEIRRQFASLLEDVELDRGFRDKLLQPDSYWPQKHLSWSFWWLLEAIPIWKLYLDQDKNLWKERIANGGNGRYARWEEPVFHVSVLLREDYLPRATFEHLPEFVY